MNAATTRPVILEDLIERIASQAFDTNIFTIYTNTGRALQRPVKDQYPHLVAVGRVSRKVEIVGMVETDDSLRDLDAAMRRWRALEHLQAAALSVRPQRPRRRRAHAVPARDRSHFRFPALLVRGARRYVLSAASRDEQVGWPRMRTMKTRPSLPLKRGVQWLSGVEGHWIPACAGMTLWGTARVHFHCKWHMTVSAPSRASCTRAGVSSACSASSMSGRVVRVAGRRGTNSVQQSWSGRIEVA